jgi:rSAM/selenodomain-associated transferase 2
MNSISIIIPTFNEENNISRLIWHLKTQATTNCIEEIIIVDGGSSDQTQYITASLIQSEADAFNIRLINANKGRAKQMNAGAQIAKGDILYFLHADSFPPNAYDRLIISEITKQNLAGCFKMRFDHKHWWLRLAGWLTQFISRACRGGDQSLFISKELFRSLDGFDEQFIIYEDIDFINKLYAKHQFTVIQESSITTSARRYNTNGIWKLQYHFWAIYVKKWFGASAEDLQAYYFKYIR